MIPLQMYFDLMCYTAKVEELCAAQRIAIQSAILLAKKNGWQADQALAMNTRLLKLLERKGE